MRTNNKPTNSEATFHGGTSRANEFYRHECGKCGAIRIDPQLGLEATPDAYVAKLVEVFREAWRVLRADGTLWCNLGDSYAASTKGAGGAGKQHTNAGSVHPDRSWAIPRGLKPKDLVGIPWMVAFALRADGWYLRSDIIWAKPNPMPESVTDRPTKSHEYLFLLSKEERYYYDADAIRDPHRWQDPEKLATNAQAQQGARLAARRREGDMTAIRVQPRLGREKGRGKQGNAESELSASEAGRNKRSVWTVPTAPYPEAHFATYPPDLIKPCILAGTKAGDTVLDPFGGSGTTGMVAIELGRKAILIELNPDYIPLIDRRCNVTPGLPL